MFTQYFSMKFNPFDKEIPVDELFESADMKELYLRFMYLQYTREMGLVVGEPGSGKSTVLRKYAKGLNHSLYKPSYMALSTLTAMDFYHSLARTRDDIFLPEAINQIHANTGEFPRPVNNLAIACLMYVFYREL